MRGFESCRWIRARLPLLAGDDLVGPDRRRVERHLVRCAACQGRLESLRGALSVLHAAGEAELVGPAPAPLWPDLARELRESRRAGTHHRARPGRWIAASGLALAASVAAIVVVATLATRHERPDRRPAARYAGRPRPAPKPPVVHTLLDPEDEPKAVADATLPRRRGAGNNAPDRRAGELPATH